MRLRLIDNCGSIPGVNYYLTLFLPSYTIEEYIAILSYYRHHQQQNAMVGSLQLKAFNHWDDKIDSSFCADRGITVLQGNYWHQTYKDKRASLHNVKSAMVSLQRSLFKAATCEGNNMTLTGELFKRYWNNKDKQVKEYYRTPFHEDLLENWGKT